MGTKAQTSGNRVAAANILVVVMAGVMLVAGAVLGLPRLKSEMAPAGKARIEKVESGLAAAANPDSIPGYYASRAMAEAAVRETNAAAANPDSIPAFYTERYYEAAAARNASDPAQSGEAEDVSVQL
jgi:hypothetical protein